MPLGSRGHHPLTRRAIEFLQNKGPLGGDVVYEVRQKGVDMRIVLDLASLVFKREVDQIVKCPKPRSKAEAATA